MWRGLSLAQKCLLVFGTAIVLVVLAALTVPWLRMTKLIDAGQQDISHQMAITWEALGRAEAAEAGAGPLPIPSIPGRSWPLPSLEQYGVKLSRGGIIAMRLKVDQAADLAKADPFLARAVAAFREDSTKTELQEAYWAGTTREYRYAKADRSGGSGASRLTGLLVLERRSVEATRLLLSNTIYLLGAGAGVLLPALLVLYIITQKLILQPVRALRDTAQRVQEGNVAIRSEIKTGDEFEHLAETFNSMLNDLQVGQDRLRSINSALDLKLHELAESNSSLYHAAKVKGEFLANVSHELRTPLNSIIGFAELLMEVAKADAERDSTPAVLKRIRYLENILTAGRNLLNLINTLLEMSRIEAGRVELTVERMNLRDACEGLVGLLAPIADKRGVQLKLEVSDDVPVISTDVKKFQQVIFNFLSNAVKFVEPMERTGRQPQVTLRAERLRGSGGPEGGQDRVRVSVIDNGPGIPREEQEKVFDKFYQLDGGHTREHTGTGLGLAISKELAQILQSELQLVSDVGRGSMFSLIMPLTLGETHVEESALEAKFRGSLAGGRTWE